jgi:hypothetical protein
MKLTKQSITKEQFLNATIKDISQVYSGKRDCCRCGCGGEYTATSYMEGVRSDINDELVEKRLKRAKRLVKEGADCFVGDTFFDVQTGKDRTLTFYFDELK